MLSQHPHARADARLIIIAAPHVHQMSVKFFTTEYRTADHYHYETLKAEEKLCT